MLAKVLEKADDLPAIDKVLLDDELSEQEQERLMFAETMDGRVFCIVANDADELLKRRAQTIRSFHFSDRETETYSTTTEVLSIIRDHASYSDDGYVADESELDKKFTEILLQAVHTGTSDIHLEIYPEYADVKFRINGMISKISEMDSRTVNRLINYIYNVAAAEGSKDTQYNPEEMQDALLDRYLDVDGKRKHFKLRLQTAPCYPNSMSIVMRVLPVDSQLSSTLESLGYNSKQIEMLKLAQMRPTGAVIIAGTTGSGKSTTLATMLADIYTRTKGSKKLLTTEDPPEYAIPGANQINLSAKKGGDQSKAGDLFVKAIKVAMRCDPDIIMVGEVRDSQSAQLLSSAVLSGHQVFTTVHASSGLAILDRMINLGFEKAVITTPHFLSLLIYQTLVPLVCQECSFPLSEFKKQDLGQFDVEAVERLEKVLNSEEYQAIVDEKNSWNKIRFANKEGCLKCRQGYVGRSVVSEMVEPKPELLEFVRNEQFDKAYYHWRKTGGRTVLDHAMDKVLDGLVDSRNAEDKCGLVTSLLKETL